ncbi:16S rRNA (cytosine(1402)-N(4))-methyltransferase, partial [bacterium]|nr:16S rRNA (cytosine(1402)-N(4))-methyltransferase [bacterium]
MSLIHKPVLIEEVVRILQPMNNKTYIDCTIGGAGHALRILESSPPEGFLVGIDTDIEALRCAKENLKNYKGRFELVNDRFER